jgi:hypothetical protein
MHTGWGQRRRKQRNLQAAVFIRFSWLRGGRNPRSGRDPRDKGWAGGAVLGDDDDLGA